MEKAKVYFIKDITPENIIKAYDILGKILPGKVAVKMHSGEKGNKNYLKPEFVKDAETLEVVENMRIISKKIFDRFWEKPKKIIKKRKK